MITSPPPKLLNFIHSRNLLPLYPHPTLHSFSKMENMNMHIGDHSVGNDSSRIIYNQPRKTPKKLLPKLPTSSCADGSLASKQRKVESVLTTMNKLAKGKLSLGAKIMQVGGAEKVFRRVFSVTQGEVLIKASKCCLSTTAGPIAGRVFISTDKLAFCSDKPIRKFISSSTGESLSFHYKAVIPLRKIKRANQSESVKNASQKYLQVITTDDFEFWFSGFVNYKRTFKCLQQALS